MNRNERNFTLYFAVVFLCIFIASFFVDVNDVRHLVGLIAFALFTAFVVAAIGVEE